MCFTLVGPFSLCAIKRTSLKRSDNSLFLSAPFITAKIMPPAMKGGGGSATRFLVFGDQATGSIRSRALSLPRWQGDRHVSVRAKTQPHSAGFCHTMQVSLLIQVLALLVVANGTPVLAKKVFGNTWGRPLDAGVAFIDGQAILGPTKTIRGIVTSVVATSLCAIVIGLGWKVGALIAATAMLGDLLSSFVKRRLHLASSSMAIGLDHLLECLLPLLACRLLLPITFVDIVAGTACFILGALLLSPLLFKLGLRDQPSNSSCWSVEMMKRNFWGAVKADRDDG